MNASCLVQEEAAAKQHSQNQVLPSSDSSSTCKDVIKPRAFIYDTSPANSRQTVQPSVACCTTPPATTNAVPAVKSQLSEPDEEELKISFMNFKAGSIALFVPVDASRKVWMAFHSNRPNRFLAQVCSPQDHYFNFYCCFHSNSYMNMQFSI